MKPYPTYATYTLPNYVKDWMGANLTMKRITSNSWLIAGDRNSMCVFAPTAACARKRVISRVAHIEALMGIKDKRRNV